jgi:hypothetical protein
MPLTTIVDDGDRVYVRIAGKSLAFRDATRDEVMLSKKSRPNGVEEIMERRPMEKRLKARRIEVSSELTRQDLQITDYFTQTLSRDDTTRPAGKLSDIRTSSKLRDREIQRRGHKHHHHHYHIAVRRNDVS